MSCSKAIIFAVVVLGAFLSGSAARAQMNRRMFSNDYVLREDMFESNPGQLEALWKARVYGEGANLETQSSQAGGFDLNLNSKYTFVKSLEARVFLRGKFEAGRSQSFFGDLEPSSGILVREAAIKWMPFKLWDMDILDVKAGVISQDWMDLPMLADRQSFPGGSMDLHYNWFKPLRTGFNGQWLIPTSQTLSSRTIDKEATPTFQTYTLYGTWNNKNLTAKQSLGHFQFANLPHEVAFESMRRGNDTRFFRDPANTDFAFNFQGWFTQTEVSYLIGSVFEPGVYLHVVKNTSAPESQNDGEIIGAGVDIHLTDYLISVHGEHFFVESDTVPAAYNSWAMGHTNKDGNGVDMSFQFKKLNFRIRGQYYDAKVINFDSLQQDQKYFYLGVETGYDKI